MTVAGYPSGAVVKQGEPDTAVRVDHDPNDTRGVAAEATQDPVDQVQVGPADPEVDLEVTAERDTVADRDRQRDVVKQTKLMRAKANQRCTCGGIDQYQREKNSNTEK